MLLQVQRTSVWLGAAVLLLAAACVSQTNRCFPDETPEPPNPRFPQGVEDFGMAMFKSMASLKEGSLFVSPYSLWSVLTLAYFGSEGRTRHQLEEALNLRSKTGTFTNWNALKFLLQGNSQTQTVAGAKFNSLNRAYFATNLILQRCLTNILFDLRRVDFTRGDTAKNIINDDVHVTTEGKISNFLDFIPPQTQLVLINAVYFKGLWATPFNPKDTRRQEFLIPPGKSGGVVDMMVQTGFFKHGYAPSLNASIVELPYQDTNTSMFVILPDTLDTDRVLQLLDRTTFQEAVSQMTRKKVEVVLPRFKLTTRVESELKTVIIHALKSALCDGIVDDATGSLQRSLISCSLILFVLQFPWFLSTQLSNLLEFSLFILLLASHRTLEILNTWNETIAVVATMEVVLFFLHDT